MALRVDLKPNERIIVGGVSIRNGDRRAALTFETQDIIVESEARTTCEKLYVLLEAIYLTDNPAELENEFVAQANVLMTAAPSMTPYLADIFDKFSRGEYYASLKCGQELIKYERQLLDLIPSESAVKTDTSLKSN
jgi:flagellar protein FlbT